MPDLIAYTYEAARAAVCSRSSCVLRDDTNCAVTISVVVHDTNHAYTMILIVGQHHEQHSVICPSCTRALDLHGSAT